MRALDDRRLLAQHNEVHICLSVLHKHFEKGRPSGWSNGPQARPFHGRRSALVDYHDCMVVPELARRGFNHRSPLGSRHGLPLPQHELGYEFWPCVTWREVLRDCRHLLEKHRSDNSFVNHCESQGIRTRVVRPTGHDEKAIQLVMEQAIVHGFHLEDPDLVLKKGAELMEEELLDPRPLPSV